MTEAVEISSDGSRLTVRLPLAIRKRGGRKAVVAPQDAAINPPRPRVDSTLIKAIARAYRWQRLLEQGTYASMRDLAVAEKISQTSISRLLRLTLLAPAIVEAVLDGRQTRDYAQYLLSQPFSDRWQSQRLILKASREPIILGSVSRAFLPWRLSDAGPVPVEKQLGPASETLHISRHSGCFSKSGRSPSAGVDLAAKGSGSDLSYTRSSQSNYRHIACHR